MGQEQNNRNPVAEAPAEEVVADAAAIEPVLVGAAQPAAQYGAQGGMVIGNDPWPNHLLDQDNGYVHVQPYDGLQAGHVQYAEHIPYGGLQAVPPWNHNSIAGHVKASGSNTKTRRYRQTIEFLSDEKLIDMRLSAFTLAQKMTKDKNELYDLAADLEDWFLGH